jgi:hypothetical protein
VGLKLERITAFNIFSRKLMNCRGFSIFTGI